MTDLVFLTDAEITAVSGGTVTQTVSVAVTQHWSSNVTMSAMASNAGQVTANAHRLLITADVSKIDHADIAAVRRFHAFKAFKHGHFGWY